MNLECPELISPMIGLDDRAIAAVTYVIQKNTLFLNKRKAAQRPSRQFEGSLTAIMYALQ